MAKGAGSNDARADFAVKLVLMFFVSILSFSIGTYLGKQVSDADHRQAALENEYSGENVASTKETYEDEAVAPIQDEVVAKLTEEAIAANRKVASEDTHEAPPAHGEATENGEEAVDSAAHASHGTKPETTKEGYTLRSKAKAEAREAYTMNNHEPVRQGASTEATNTASAAKTQGATDNAKKVEAIVKDAGDRVATGMAPSADPKKVTPPTTTLPTVATSAAGKYTVQVASYATTQEAETYAGKLKDKGYPAFVVPAEIGGKTWYRVSLGKFADQTSAKNYLGELKASQAVSSAIVQKLIQ